MLFNVMSSLCFSIGVNINMLLRMLHININMIGRIFGVNMNIKSNKAEILFAYL